MSFDPKSFLDTARELSASNKEESVRTMVNRAYYAAFGVAREKTGVYKSKETHQSVIKYLTESEDHKLIKVGKSLEALYLKRQSADYAYKNNLYASAYSNVINDAKSIISRIEAIFDKQRSSTKFD